MNPPYKRRLLMGAVLSLGLLGAVPGVTLAAQPSCGDTIYVNTTLTGNLDCSSIGNGTALYFGAKNITLNLGGHTLIGPSGADSSVGIDTNYKKNVTVKHGKITGFDESIYVDYSVAGTFKNLTIVGDWPTDSDNYGIYVYGPDNVFTNLTITDSYIGVYLYETGGNWLTNNHFTTDEYGVYDEYENGDHFVNNVAKDYTYAGFYEDYSGNQVWQGNTADGGGTSGTDGDYGFYFDGSDYGWYQITNNSATGNNSYGFYTYELYEDYNAAGPVSHFTGNTASYNNGGGDATGWYDDGSYYAVMTNNVANHNGEYGFEVYDSGYMVFNSNRANHNGSDGIYLSDNYTPFYAPAQVKNNTANFNGSYGIDSEYGQPGATGNVAHDNSTSPDDCWNINCNN